MLHADPTVSATASLDCFLETVEFGALRDDAGAAIVGVSLGGLVAALAQERTGRPGLVIAISSPTSYGDVSLVEYDRGSHRRIALYGSHDPVIAGRVEDWPRLADAQDLPWLDHDTDRHIERLAPIFRC